MSDFSSASGPPPFEDPFSDSDVEQQIYAVVLQTREPTAASAISERVNCDPKTARKYLRWFAQLGIVTEYGGHRATYERNNAYFEWRRINDLVADNSQENLQSHVGDLTERIHVYEQQYEAETPADVDVIEAAKSDDARTIDDVYGDLGDWATARQERRRYERARQQHTDTIDRERASS